MGMVVVGTDTDKTDISLFCTLARILSGTSLNLCVQTSRSEKLVQHWSWVTNTGAIYEIGQLGYPRYRIGSQKVIAPASWWRNSFGFQQEGTFSFNGNFNPLDISLADLDKADISVFKNIFTIYR